MSNFFSFFLHFPFAIEDKTHIVHSSISPIIFLMISLSKYLKNREKRIQARSDMKSFGFFHRFTSAILIFLLFLSQTIHVDFFDPVGALDSRQYDIVSIFVDKGTYSELRSEVKRYATDIQGYLPHTRTNIIVTDKDTLPATIAAENEKLYYEGDG